MNLIFGKGKRERNYWEKGDKDSFLRNGAMLLEKLISSSHGKYYPIRSFSAKELMMATNNYHEDKVIVNNGCYKLYKCFLQKRPISVMMLKERLSEYCFNNIVFASQISHKNVLKLIGCCLETVIPILVFEYVEYGTLDDHIYRSSQSRFKPFSWSNRLKIAMEIANAISYLHIGLHRPIVFADIKPSNIIFNEHYIPKLFDFSLSHSIPEGKTHIECMVQGTLGYIAPEFYACNLNEKYDIYSFGGLLFVLLTGQKMYHFDNDTSYDYCLLDYVKKYNKENRLYELVDPIIRQDGQCIKREQQLHSFSELAFKCLSESAEERPTMIDVAKQLRQLYRSSM